MSSAKIYFFSLSNDFDLFKNCRFDLNFNKIDCFYNPNIKNYNAESSIGLDNHDDI